MEYNRAHFEDTNKYLYETYNTSADKCFYCGDPSECTDHSPALIDVYNIGTDKLIERGVKFYLVPCCNECNMALSHGREKLWLWRRTLWLITVYQSRYKRILHIPVHTHEMLMEYGPNLRQYVLTGLIVQESILKRLAFLEERAGTLDQDDRPLLCDFCSRILPSKHYTKKGERRRFCSSSCRSKWWNSKGEAWGEIKPVRPIKQRVEGLGSGKGKWKRKGAVREEDG